MAQENQTRTGNIALKIAGRTIGALIVISAIAVTAYVTRLYYIFPRTDDAYIRANVVGVAPHVSGPIIQLPVADNQHVKAGDMLFVIDPRPYQAALDMAQARLALTELEIKGLQDAIAAAGSRQKQLQPEAAQAAVDNAHSVQSKAEKDLGQYGDINARRKAAEAAVYNASLNVEY